MNGNEQAERRLSRLMRAAQDGDAPAYAALLREVAPLLRNAVRGRGRSLQPPDVEDLVQDVLLSLHAVRATYDPDRPFLPWLFGIMRNRMADRARRHARRAAHEVAVERLPETLSDEAANMEHGYRDPQALRQAIAALPRGQREAVEMLRLRELSLKEAAAASGTSVAALKVAVHRAVRALRKLLVAGT